MAHPKAGRPGEGAPVKYFAALLLSKGVEVREVLEGGLGDILGEVDFIGGPHPFDMTDYYEDEMGSGLSRVIVSFLPLGEAPDLVEIKLSSRRLEEKLSCGAGRTVNVDPGYIDYFKAVLASFKEGPQKIYLGRGVYADPVLMFEDGQWRVLPWSFPDFREGLYMEEFGEIRHIYREQRRDPQQSSTG
jgi:hypothetical protein